MIAEFDLIREYLLPGGLTAGTDNEGQWLGCDDDAAVLKVRPGHRLAVSVDTSVADTHFPSSAPAHAIGHRALAVALSDLAAMGATPRWCFMALTLDQRQWSDRHHDLPAWLGAFARGFHDLNQQVGSVLAGGDVTTGPLAISVTVMGELPEGQAIGRQGARPGDLIAITGYPGEAAAGLAAWQHGERDPAHSLLARYLYPRPRLAAGQALRGLVSAGIDVSDGLLADLGHLRAASEVGAELDLQALPLSSSLLDAVGQDQASRLALGGGDDYELLVTLSPSQRDAAMAALRPLGLSLTVIGHCLSTPGLAGVPPDMKAGWQHFAGEAP